MHFVDKGHFLLALCWHFRQEMEGVYKKAEETINPPALPVQYRAAERPRDYPVTVRCLVYRRVAFCLRTARLTLTA